MAIDKVKPLKLEDPESGGTETDQFPTSLDSSEDHIQCAGLVIEDSTHSDENVRIWRDGSDLKLQDTNNTPITLSEVLTESKHLTIDQLTHQIDESSFDEVTRVSGKVTNVTVWDSYLKTKKIREDIISRVSGKVSQVITIQYDSSGSVKETLTEVFYRSNGKVNSITRTRA